MKTLPLFELENINKVIEPEHFIQLTLDSPAKTVLTDFKYQKALVISNDTLAADVLKLMLDAHVQMKLIISKQGDFLGMISTNELSERYIVAEVAKGNRRDEIYVEDLMVHRDDLFAFDYDDLQQGSVKDVVNALKSNNLRHCLVVDKKHNHIRGIISASDIARKLHIPIAINDKASFSKLFDIIHS